MRFEEALKAMREGKKVRLPRSSWLVCCYMVNDKNEETMVAEFNDFTAHEILSEDWEICDD